MLAVYAAAAMLLLETLICLHVVFGKASEMQGIDLFIHLCIWDVLGISCVFPEVTVISN